LEGKDLKAAKKRLAEEGLTLCIVREGQVLFETSSRGISGFLRATEELNEQLHGASVADKVVGKAVALMCLYTRIGAVYAPVMSRKARELFEHNAVRAEWDELVDDILGSCKVTSCPFERLATKITDPSEAYIKLKALQDSLKQRG